MVGGVDYIFTLFNEFLILADLVFLIAGAVSLGQVLVALLLGFSFLAALWAGVVQRAESGCATGVSLGGVSGAP